MKLPRIIPPELSDLRRRVADLEAQVAALIAAMEGGKSTPAPQSMRGILADVSARHGVPVDAIMGRERTQRITRARQEAMALARQGGRSLEQIARVFQRDHTTVMDGIRRHEERARQ